MSSPKCSQYEIDQRIAREQAAAEEARRKEAERQRLDELRLIREWTEKIQRETQAIESANSAIHAAQAQFPDEVFPQPATLPPAPLDLTSASLATHCAVLSGITQQAQALMNDVNQALANLGMRRVIAQSSAHIKDDAKSLEDWLNETRAARAGVPPATLEARQAVVTRLMTGLDPVEQTADVKHALALYLEEFHAPRLELLETQLRVTLQYARQQVTERRKYQAEAEAMLLQLPTIDVPNLASLREELQRVACGLAPWAVGLPSRLAAVQRAAAIELEDRCAGDIFASALEGLGYTVKESFATLLVSDGEAFVQRPGSGDYYVAVRVDKASRQLTLSAVRDGDTASVVSQEMARRDAEAEAVFCKDFPKIVNSLAKEGIRTRLIRVGRLGAKDVEVRDLSASQREKPRERQRSKPQTKTRSGP